MLKKCFATFVEIGKDIVTGLLILAAVIGGVSLMGWFTIGPILFYIGLINVHGGIVHATLVIDALLFFWFIGGAYRRGREDLW